MLYAHLKQGLRLNRTIGFAFTIYIAYLAFDLQGAPKAASWWLWGRLAVFAALTVVFMLINEMGLRTVKRHPKLDEFLQEKTSLLCSLMLTGYIALGYLLTGQLSILLFSTLAFLQAQMVGHQLVARMQLLFFGLLTLAALPFGYPLLLGVKVGQAPEPLRILLLLTPFVMALFHYGSIVSTLVFSTTSKVNKLQSLAATDGLTGLINRRQFNNQLDAEIARAKRYRKPLSLALFDIDNFKKINDFYGHQTGDRILRELGALLTGNVRESDIPARYGGEEFALILPETSQMDAYELLERIRTVIEHTVFCLPDNPMTVTVSVGVAQLNPDNPKSYELIERADAALYEAKRQGKNRVIYGILPTPKISYPPFTP
ncbi:MAG TPA: diguanylate cyclase [Oculatellaceae cyanobacterium]|jgi:diguanylate cyclase (GGDEF)-like protein